MIAKVGFTESRHGMSNDQRLQLMTVLESLGDAREFHHGAAAGADTEAAVIARSLSYNVIAHPAGENPLDRNHDIVAEAEILIAAPKTDQEVLRSGTWATIRYARKKGIPVVMLSRYAVVE